MNTAKFLTTVLGAVGFTSLTWACFVFSASSYFSILCVLETVCCLFVYYWCYTYILVNWGSIK